jgi:hypothetical protein
MSEAVVDELEPVEVEEQDGRQGAVTRQTRERMLEPVEEQRPIGQPGERVVQRTMADLVLGRLALERVGQYVGQRLEEVQVAGVVLTHPPRLHTEHAEWAGRSLDGHDGAALGAEGMGEQRLVEALLRVPVGDHDRTVAEDRVAGVRAAIERRAGRLVDPPTDAGSEHQAFLLGEKFHHAGRLDTEDLGGEVHRLLHQVGGAPPLECVLAEPGHRGLLCCPLLELLLGQLLFGDVGEHAVPTGMPGVIGDQHGVIADPHDATLAIDHPVLAGASLENAVGRLGLGVDHPVAVLGVQPVQPQAGALHPFPRREAEEILNSRADVMPAPLGAAVGHVDDSWYTRQQVDIVGSNRLGRQRASTGFEQDAAPVRMTGHSGHYRRLSRHREHTGRRCTVFSALAVHPVRYVSASKRATPSSSTSRICPSRTSRSRWPSTSEIVRYAWVTAMLPHMATAIS